MKGEISRLRKFVGGGLMGWEVEHLLEQGASGVLKARDKVK